ERPGRRGEQVSTRGGPGAPACAPQPDRRRGPDGSRASACRAAAGGAPAAARAHRPAGPGQLGLVVQRRADRPPHGARQRTRVVDAPDGARGAPGPGREETRRAGARTGSTGGRHGGGTPLKTHVRLFLLALLAAAACSRPPSPPTTIAGDLGVRLAL